MTETLTDSDRIERLEQTVKTLAWWLVQAQTGFGEQDARGIEALLNTAAASARTKEEA
jgi:hypothetical protein